jgi:hypothetical protein
VTSCRHNSIGDRFGPHSRLFGFGRTGHSLRPETTMQVSIVLARVMHGLFIGIAMI